MTDTAEKPTRTHDLHTYKVLSPDWLTEHEPRVLEHMVTHPDGTYEMSVMSEIGDGVYIAWSSCRRCSKQYVVCSCKEGPLEPEHITKSRAERWAGSFDTRPDLGVDRTVIQKVVKELRDRGYVVGEIPEPVIKEVKVPVVDNSLFVKLFQAVGACEAPEGTQVDDVLEEFQEAYDEITGHVEGQPLPVVEDLEDLAVEGLTEKEADDFMDALDDSTTVEPGQPAETVETGGSARPTVEQAATAAKVQTAIDPETTIQDDPLTAEDLVDEDAIEFARETLGPDASEDEVQGLAEQRADRDLKEIEVGF